jgi:integrase
MAKERTTGRLTVQTPATERTFKDEFNIIPEPARTYLNSRQEDEYYAHRKRLITWLITAGRNPEEEIGLALRTAKNYASRIDQFYRWMWEENGYTTHLTSAVADQYVKQLATDEIQRIDGEPYSTGSKRKMANAVAKLFEWRHHEFGDDLWEPKTRFKETSYNHVDVLTIEERTRIRDGVLEFETIPAYNNLSPEERDRWKTYLAQKLGKQKADISPDDWESLNTSWKFPSLFRTALDAGLRPCEVERAKTSWIRLEKGTLYIPKTDAAKNRENWKIALRPDTALALEKWLEQRANLEKYDGREELWLNRQANPYTSKTLNHWFRKLCDHVGIDRTNRDLTWYSIRHSVGTLMVSKGNLAEARDQLRHKSTESTLQYVHTTTEDREKTLDKIG